MSDLADGPRRAGGGGGRAEPEAGASSPGLDLPALQAKLDASPFIKLLGLQAVSLDRERGELVVRMPMRPELERGARSGQFHGGAIASLVDIAGDYVLIMRLGHGVPTIDFRVDFLRPAVDTDLVATGRLRRAGRTIGVVDVDVHDAAGRLVAVGRCVYGTAGPR
jgi:uncharacterized protein (TIGR00369 family)